MFDSYLQYFQSTVEFFVIQLIKVVGYPFAANQRIYWLYLGTSLLLALYAYYDASRKAPARTFSTKAVIGFLFPKEVWSNPSAWLDVRYFFFHQIFRVIIYGTFLTGAMTLMFGLLTGGSSIVDASSSNMDTSVRGIALATAYMFVIFAVADLVSYGLHYMQHKVPFFWEFHKVHHSLEVMHPLSNYREHPVDNVVYAACVGASYGLVMGLASLLFGYVPSMPQLLGIPLVMFAFNILGYNLRHSHIWLRWPGRWSMIFASPAHHQIHHSCHPDHINKNFGFIFPCWDVLFHTYQMPETNKDVRFGISEDYVNEFKTCLGLYFIPFRNVWRLFFKAQDVAIKES